MPEYSATDQMLRGLRAGLAPVSEFIHVSAIYMGLAVLTTLGLSLILPSMRQQSQQLHEVVLAMFQANDDALDEAPDDVSPDWTTPGKAVALAAVPALAEQGAVAGLPEPDAALGSQPAAPSASPGGLDFTRALQQSLQDEPLKGVTRAQDHGLRSYLARKYHIAPSVAGALIRTAFVVGAQEKVDPQLLLAVMAIESRYNPFLESAMGAQGLMQVLSSVHREKLKSDGGRAAVFNPVVNIRVGAQILSDCIRRRGSVPAGLTCYVGATGSDSAYGAKVLAEQRRIALASGIPPGRK